MIFCLACSLVALHLGPRERNSNLFLLVALVLVSDEGGVLVGEADEVLIGEEDGEGFSSLIIIGLTGGESSTTSGSS